jgi:o-succinylbenzoate---CoA ligase
MSAPASEHPGECLRIVEVPAGPDGADVARAVIDGALGGTAPPTALVHDAARALEVLRPTLPLEDERTRVILMTSGSTGDPKGVCWSTDNLRAMAQAWSDRYPELAESPRIVALPVTSAGGLGVIVRAVLDRAPMVTIPTLAGAGRFDAETFARTVQPVADAGPTVSLVPTQVALLLDHDAGRRALRSMRRVFLGGALAPKSLLRSAADLGMSVTTTYGMTETCGGCIHDGTPLPGVSVEVDIDGRIHLAGPMTALGYRLRPEESATAFDGPRFTTADLGAWRDGRLQVIGRVDDIVQVRGTNVALGAVETALLGEGLAQEAVAYGFPDAVEGTRITVAIVPAPPWVDRSWEDWMATARDRLRQLLGSPAVPRDFRRVSVVPYLPGGKIDRPALRARLETARASAEGI